MVERCMYTTMIVIVISFLHRTMADKGSSQNASLSFKNVLKGYDRYVRPFADEKPTSVKVQISLLDVGPVNEKDFTFRVDIFLRQWWHDPRLNFKQGHVSFNGNPKNLIWLPDLFIRNSHSVKMHSSTTETIRTRIEHNGDVFMSTRQSAVCSCKMNLKRYPMDEQQCSIEFESYAYSSSELAINWHSVPLEYNKSNIQIEGYKLIAIDPSSEKIKYVTGESFDIIKISFDVERTFLYYVFRTYFPSSFLVIMTWGTFYIPATSYPARCALIVTNFLASAFVLQGASSQITKVPYATAIEIFLLANISFILFTMLEYMLVIQTPNDILCRKRPCRSVRENQDNIELEKNGETNLLTKPPDKNESTSKLHDIDKLAMIVIPAMYFIFLLCYFSFFMKN